MPTASQLARMRARQEAHMPFTCTVSTPGEPTRDAFNEEVAGAPTESTVACGAEVATGRELLAGGGVAGVGEPILRLPARTVIAATTTVVRQAADGDAERTYRVKAPLAGGSYETALRVLVTEV